MNVAELVFTAVSEIFKHGLTRHVVTANPCAGISIAAICGKPEPKRQRLKLTEDELQVILPALPGIGAENALAVKIQLATCKRLGELTKAEWAHVDFDRAEWFVPDQNRETGRCVTISLPPAIVGWFRELEPFACGSRFVLPAQQVRRTRSYGGEVHFEQHTMNFMLHKLCNKLGDKARRFTPHDLRSTDRSHLAALGVNILVTERCLKHSLGSLRRGQARPERCPDAFLCRLAADGTCKATRGANHPPIPPDSDGLLHVIAMHYPPRTDDGTPPPTNWPSIRPPCWSCKPCTDRRAYATTI